MKSRKIKSQKPQIPVPVNKLALTRYPSPCIFEAIQLPEEEKIEKIAFHFAEIMKILGMDLTHESLAKTPQRVARMYIKEVFSGLDPDNFPSTTTMQETLPYGQEHPLVLTQTRFISFCEHHFVPMQGKVYIGYIPHNKLMGLSKIPRIVRFFASRPQLQERLTLQIHDCLSTILDTEDVAILIEAHHFCVSARGVRDESSLTSTQHLTGSFAANPLLKHEFLDSVARLMRKEALSGLS